MGSKASFVVLRLIILIFILPQIISCSSKLTKRRELASSDEDKLKFVENCISVVSVFIQKGKKADGRLRPSDIEDYIPIENLKRVENAQVILKNLPISAEVRTDLYDMLQTPAGLDFVFKLLVRLDIISENRLSEKYLRYITWFKLVDPERDVPPLLNRKVKLRNSITSYVNKVASSKERIIDDEFLSDSRRRMLLAKNINDWLSFYNNNQKENGRSLEIIIQRGKEILNDDIQFPTAKSKNQAIEEHFSQIYVTGKFYPLPTNIVSKVLSFVIPMYGEFSQRVKMIYKKIMGNTEISKEIDIADNMALVLKEISIKDRRIKIRTDKLLREKSEYFLRKYLDESNSHLLDNQEFLDDLAVAYPEAAIIRDAISDRSSGSRLVNGAFGKRTNEFYRVINRAKFTMALIKNEKDYFPNLSDRSFDKLRENLLKFNRIIDEKGSIDYTQVDKLMSFLMSDTVGRADSYIIREMVKRLSLNEKLAGDFEKIAYEIIEHYPLSSQSLAKQAPNDFTSMVKTYHLLNKVNFGQIPFLESGPHSFSALLNEDPKLIALALSRYKLSLASIPIPGNEDVAFLLKENLVSRINKMEEFVMSLKERDVTGRNISDQYWNYVEYMAENLHLNDINMDRDLDLVSVRLAAMTRLENGEDTRQAFEVLIKEFENSSEAIDFYKNMPMQAYFAPDTRVELQKLLELSGLSKNEAMVKSVEIWGKWLKKVAKKARLTTLVKEIQNMNNEEVHRLVQDAGEFRIYFSKLKEFVSNQENIINKIRRINEIKIKINTEDLPEDEKIDLVLTKRELEKDIAEIGGEGTENIVNTLLKQEFNLVPVDNGFTIELI